MARPQSAQMTSSMRIARLSAHEGAHIWGTIPDAADVRLRNKTGIVHEKLRRKLNRLKAGVGS